MRHRRIGLILLTIMGGTAVDVQAADPPGTRIVHFRIPDDLEPEPGLIGGFSWDLGIAVEWHRRLLADAGQWPRCLTVVDDAEELGRKGEVAVWLSRDKKRDVIFVRRATRAISSWLLEKAVADANPGRPDPGEAPQIVGAEAAVDARLADALEKSWEMMMNRVVQPRGEPTRSMHPTWVHFGHWDEVWNYRGGRFEGYGFDRLLEVEPSRPRPVQLASLARWMVEYAEAPVGRRSGIRETLLQDATKFISSLRNLGEVEPDIRKRRLRQAPAPEAPRGTDGRRRTSR